MTLEMIVNTYKTCGVLDEDGYENLIEDGTIYNKYKNLELRKCEMIFFDLVVRNHITNIVEDIMYMLRENIRTMFETDEDYDKFIYEIINLNSKYDKSRYSNIIISNAVNNINYFMELNNKDIEFFKICDSDYTMKFLVDKTMYELDGFVRGEDGIRKFMLTNTWGTSRLDILLMVLDKNNKVQVYDDEVIKNNDMLVAQLKREIDNEMNLAVIASMDDAVELFNQMSLLE